MRFLQIIPAEELANTITHGIGIVLSLISGIGLVIFALQGGDIWQIVSALVFSLALILVYTASTAYHAVQHSQIKARLKIMDHVAIYLLIAGTYTPFTLVGLRGFWGWSLFGIVWALALLGIITKLFTADHYTLLSTLTYLAMGWIVLVVIVPVLSTLPTTALIWLLIGGLLYTIGTYFFYYEPFPYAHAIWHLFVLAGSACHLIAVTTQVLPA